MKYFLRYLCAFCTCRILWSFFRHSPAKAVQHSVEPCPHGLTGVWLFLAGVVAAPFIYGGALTALALWLHW